MISYRLFHLLESIVLPSCRNFLISRVSPGIRIVKVNHQAIAESLSTTCLGDDIILTAPTTFRIYPHTKTDGIGTKVAKKPHTFLCLTILIIEFHTILFHLCEPADIGSLSEAAHIICFLLFRNWRIVAAATCSCDREQERCSQQYGFSKYILHFSFLLQR